MSMGYSLLGYQRSIMLHSWFPERNQVMLFHESLGRTVFSVAPRVSLHSLMRGSVVTFVMVPWKDRMRITHAELHALPHTVIRGDILFIHQLCECIRFFATEADSIQELFDLCTMLYDERAEHLTNVLQQQLFFCKFFALLGIYPEESVYTTVHEVRTVLSLPFEIMIRHMPYNRYAVSSWVDGCIQMHPEMRMLKTVPSRYSNNNGELCQKKL